MDKFKFEEVIFVGAFVVSFYFVISNWYGFLLDEHSFRQTQTAITAFYLKKEGFKLDYITPVLGYPWTIPFEFPTYQLLVAYISEITSFSIESCGRFVNLMFFYLSFFFIYVLLNDLKIKNSTILIVFSFILLSPVYIFWSRTFMIESTAMFFGIVTTSLLVRYIITNKKKYLLFMVFTCIITALTKITTLVSFGLLNGLLLLYFFSYDKIFWTFIKRCLILASVFLVALIVGYLWVNYTDELKNISPLSTFITSTNLTNWNFGTLVQRITLETWSHIFIDHIVKNLGYTFSFGIIVFILTFYYKKINKLSLVFLCAFLLTLMIFTNLFYVHSYYFYPISLFAIIFTVLVIESLFNNLIVKRLVIFVLLLLQINIYTKNYYISQNQLTENNKAFEIGSEINKNLQDNSLIIVYGDDWNSRIPYYSMKKAIMLREDVSNIDFWKSIEKSGGINNFNALVIKANKLQDFRKNYLEIDKYNYKEAYKIGDYIIFYSKKIADNIKIPISLKTMLHNTSSPIQPEIKFYNGEWILFAHMQSISELPIEKSNNEQIYNFSYGIEDLAYTNGGKVQGACYEIYSFDEINSNFKLLWNNCLYPLTKISDRGIIKSKISISKDISKLYLYAKPVPGKSTDYGWTFWGDFYLEDNSSHNLKD